MKEFQVLKKFVLYYCALHEGFFDLIVGSQDEVSFYLFGDKGYRLFP